MCLRLLLATIHIFNMQAQVEGGIHPNLCSSLSVGVQRHLMQPLGGIPWYTAGKISEVEVTQAEISSKRFFFQKYSLEKHPETAVPHRQSGFCVPGMTTLWCACRGQQHGWVKHVRHCSEIASQDYALLWGINNSRAACQSSSFISQILDKYF